MKTKNTNRYTSLLFFAFSIVLSLLAAMSVSAINQMNSIKGDVDRITQENNVKSSYVWIIRDAIRERQTYLRDILLEDDLFARDDLNMKFLNMEQTVLKAILKYKAMLRSDAEKELFERLITNMDEAYGLQNELIDNALEDESFKSNSKVITAAFNSQRGIILILKELNKKLDASTANSVQAANLSYSKAKSTMTIFGLISILIGIVIAFGVISKHNSLSEIVDDTMRKLEKALQQLKVSNTGLEKAVAVKTEDLAIAKNAALAAVKVKDQFLATMSHELRTPLNAILGYSDMLIEQVEVETYCDIEDIKKIKGSGKHLLKLVTDILQVSQISAGSLILENRKIDMNYLIKKLSKNFTEKLNKNNNVFLTSVGSSAQSMYADESLLYEALHKILDNAATFTANGEISIHVQDDQEVNGKIVFTVKDNGVGIADDQLINIFDSFRQIDNSTTRAHQGAGLGLSISKSLIELMGGNIKIESTIGKGSAFHIVLPKLCLQNNDTANLEPLKNTA
jgi:signal transduction histidine kinase